MTMIRTKVNLPARSYEVLIENGLLAGAAQQLRQLLGSGGGCLW